MGGRGLHCLKRSNLDEHDRRYHMLHLEKDIFTWTPDESVSEVKYIVCWSFEPTKGRPEI
jgi:hypothetical protein